MSAARGDGIEELLRAIGDRLRAADRVMRLSVPFERGEVMAALHREGEVLSMTFHDGAAIIDVVLD